MDAVRHERRESFCDCVDPVTEVIGKDPLCDPT